MTLPWTEATAAQIGADWLLDATAPAGAYGRSARERERALEPGDEDDALHRMRAALAGARSRPPEALSTIAGLLRAMPDVRPILSRALAGTVLSDDDLFELDAFASDVARVAGAQGADLSGPETPYAAAAALGSELEPGRGAGRSFYLDDAFDPALAAARTRAAEAQAACDLARSHVREAVARALGLESVRDGEFTLARDGAPALPGNVRVVREGATYLLCRIEPDDAEVAAVGRRDASAAEVADAEEAVRARLSAFVATNADTLGEVCVRLGALDLMVARARFAQRYACALPEVVALEADAMPSVEVDGLRFLPLEEELARTGRAYTPLSFSLEGVAVITGPNMGGKSAAMRALGFACACVALGIPVPARAARLPLFGRIAWLGLGAAHESSLLSSFGREVVEARTFLEGAGARELVLVDEFARTTSPREGRALAVAFIEALRARRACGFVATHLDGIAPAAGVAHFATAGLDAAALQDQTGDLDAALARIGAAMDYRVVEIAPGDEPPSNALTLAGALGLPHALVERARALLRGG